MVKDESGQLTPTTWEDALTRVAGAVSAFASLLAKIKLFIIKFWETLRFVVVCRQEVWGCRHA